MVYYYQSFGREIGPIDIEELKRAGITPDTYVWREGMANWCKAKDLPELSAIFIANNSSTFSHSQYNTPPNEPCPPTNLIWGILVTLLCCIPFGIVSIVYASKVENAYISGNLTLSKSYSKKAANWAIWGAIASAIGIVFSLILTIFGVALPFIAALPFLSQM